MNDKILRVNSIVCTNALEASEWQNIYRQTLDIRAVHSFSSQYDYGLNVPAFISSFKSTSTIAGHQYYNEAYDRYEVLQSRYTDAEIITVEGTYSWGTDVWGNTTFPALSYTVYVSGFYINPNSGCPISFSFSDTFSSHIGIYSDATREYYDYTGEGTIVDVPTSIGFENGCLGFVYTHYTNGGRNREVMFRPEIEIPYDVSLWQSDLPGGLSLSNVLIPQNIPLNITCSAAAVFSEKFSDSVFLCDIPSAFTRHSNNRSSGTLAGIDNPHFSYFNYWNVNSLSQDKSFYSQGLHIFTVDYEHFFVFRSELHPEIFDFRAEVERSNLS